jgi:NAD-dependent SIR2 family protein deacetylase
MQKAYQQCQSCGMPMKKDKNGGGSESGGTLSPKYCSSCYQDGAFIKPEMTLTEMQSLVDRVLKDEMGWWKVFRWLAARQLPTLERWKAK